MSAHAADELNRRKDGERDGWPLACAIMPQILRDAALVEATWQKICEANGLPHGHLPAKEIANALKALPKDHPNYPKADVARIRNRLSGAKTWAEAHGQWSNYQGHVQRLKGSLTI